MSDRNVKVCFILNTNTLWFLTFYRFPIQGRSKHIIQCQRKESNAAPYQQRYKNGKRAHRRVPRSFLEFCYLCAKWFPDETEWRNHCAYHLNNLKPWCRLLMFWFMLVAPGFCPFCLGDTDKEPKKRFQQWLRKITLIEHIDDHIKQKDQNDWILCPHPCCRSKEYQGGIELRRHFFDAHSVEKPRPNCVAKKRRQNTDSDMFEAPEAKKPLLERNPDSKGNFQHVEIMRSSKLMAINRNVNKEWPHLRWKLSRSRAGGEYRTCFKFIAVFWLGLEPLPHCRYLLSSESYLSFLSLC